VTESIFTRSRGRLRLVELHFAIASTLAYLSAAPAFAQADPADTESEVAVDEMAVEEKATDDAASVPTEGSPAEPTPTEPTPTEPSPTDSGQDAPTTSAATESSEGVVVASGSGLFESGGEASPDSPAEKSGDSFELGGYARGDLFVGVLPATGDAGMNAAYGEVSLQVNAKKGDLGSAFMDFRMRAGQQLDTADLFLDLREAYVNMYLGPLDLRVGKQIVVWGRADAFNPTSNLTPLDFRIRSLSARACS
jgi:hypothetical protein